ncbi:MAG: hypothetical protein DRO92_00560 [Candidatus Altiarchaeales archaeon]|nr:MAG: hypothetical protein DRO92_00560 [Candidatus Altiarchaeales archaeon]
MISFDISYLDITYLLLYLVVGMCFISYIWMRESIKRLSVGLIEDLFKTFLWIIRWSFLYAVWLFLSEVSIKMDIIRIPLDESVKTLINSIFLAILLMIITYTTVKARSIGKIYGFKMD